jgi:hypothetical protein
LLQRTQVSFANLTLALINVSVLQHCSVLFNFSLAELEGAKRAVGDKTAELTALQRQSQSLPVEVDAAKTAEAEARLQLDRNKQGER